MSALADALVAAQSRAVAALGKLGEDGLSRLFGATR